MPYPKKVYLNGKIIDSQEAKISVFDRGFLFGDGVYEVLIRINGHFFYGDAHLQRLSESLKKVSIQYDISVLKNKIERLLEASDLQENDSLIYIQITRGIAPRKHAFPADTEPTVMMYATPLTVPDINQSHLNAVTTEDVRWLRCDIKMTSLLGNVMANDYAAKRDAYESLFVRDGRITEASHCNVFFVKDAVVYTHPADEFILNGITRQITLDLCKELGLEVHETPIMHKDLKSMDEAFLTGTTTHIASIRKIDDHNFYKGEQHPPLTRMLQEAYSQLKKNVVNL